MLASAPTCFSKGVNLLQAESGMYSVVGSYSGSVMGRFCCADATTVQVRPRGEEVYAMSTGRPRTNLVPDGHEPRVALL